VVEVEKVTEDDDHIGILAVIGDESQCEGCPVDACAGDVNIGEKDDLHGIP
jgi:hypothetical protein